MSLAAWIKMKWNSDHRREDSDRPEHSIALHGPLGIAVQEPPSSAACVTGPRPCLEQVAKVIWQRPHWTHSPRHGDEDPHLIQCFLGSKIHPKLDVDLFSRFCTSHPRDSKTGIRRDHRSQYPLLMHSMRPKNDSKKKRLFSRISCSVLFLQPKLRRRQQRNEQTIYSRPIPHYLRAHKAWTKIVGGWRTC